MPQQQEQGPCILVVGIVLGVLGFAFNVWFLMGIGGFLFIIGICIIIQEANKVKTESAPQPVAQPVAQPAPQPVAQPVPQPAPQHRLEQKFCPHCGAKASGDICSDCGSPID